MLRKKLLNYSTLVIAMIMVLVGCDQERTIVGPIPADGGPAIALINPTNNNFLDTVGGTITATFRLDDNEALEVFRDSCASFWSTSRVADGVTAATAWLSMGVADASVGFPALSLLAASTIASVGPGA